MNDSALHTEPEEWPEPEWHDPVYSEYIKRLQPEPRSDEDKRQQVAAAYGGDLLRKDEFFGVAVESPTIEEGMILVMAPGDAPPPADPIDNVAYYSGTTVMEFLEAMDLGFALGNTVKYIARAGKKDPAKEVEDLEKAAWYLDRRIKQLKGEL